MKTMMYIFDINKLRITPKNNYRYQPTYEVININNN